jgi:serine/threonine protein kinase/uncharacterized membrane protein
MTTQRFDRSRFGKFEMIEKIGEGGMGMVYRARQTVVDRIVALKIPKPELLRDPQILARFSQEARNAKRLNHPHIVPIYDVDEVVVDGRNVPYIEMPFVEGQTLSTLLTKRGRLSPGEAAEIMRQVGLALDYAHQQGIVHRDLKPSNVMITNGGLVYLMDFGLARDVASPSGVTVAGSWIGTPEYMSPEQANRQTSLSPASDIYSLGLILYEMLTGKLPFTGETVEEVIAARVEKSPIPPNRWGANLPQPVENVVMRGLARNPERRFRTAGDLVQALQEAVGVAPPVNLNAPQQAVEANAPTQLAPQNGPVGAEMPKTVVLQVPSQSAGQGNLPPPPTNPPPGGPPQMPHGWSPTPQPGGQVPQGWTPTPPPPGHVPGGKRPGSTGRNLLIGLIAGLALLLVALGSGFVWFRNDQNTRATATARAQATATARAEATGTARAEATATARAEATATARAEATATARAEATATARAEATAAAIAQATSVAATQTAAVPTAAPVAPAAAADAWEGAPLVGPEEGSMEHVEDQITVSRLDTSIDSMVVDARFFTPYDAASGTWDYGLIFRETEAAEYHLVLTSDNTWELRLRRASETQDQTINSGQLSSLDGAPNGPNRMRLITIGSFGWFFVNDVFVSQIDLSGHEESGDVLVGTGFFQGNTRPGATTRYDSFAVWELAADRPADGSMPHEIDGQIEFSELTAEPRRDFLASLTFTNPYAADQADWDYGLAFRDNRQGYYALMVQSNSVWSLYYRATGQEGRKIGDGQLTRFALGAGEQNNVVLITSGPTGLLIVNDELAGVLDLSDNNAAGGISALTGYFADSEVPGSATDYSSVTLLWSPQ